MEIPTFCGSTEFARSLDFCRQKIGTVMKSFDSGAFIEKDLKDLIMATRRVTHVCRELLKARNFKMMLEAAKGKDDEFDQFWWE